MEYKLLDILLTIRAIIFGAEGWEGIQVFGEACFCDSRTNSELMYNSTVILKKYENGNIASMQEIKNKKFNGLYASWWRNGNRRAQGRFINGREDGDYLHGIKMEINIFQGA